MTLQQDMQSLDELINTGRWKEAHALAKRLCDPYWDKADVWLKLALACGLLGRMEERTVASTTARRCNDYTPEKEGDDDRDLAICLIKQGNLETAKSLVQVARRLHVNDENRLGALDMIEGRILLRDERYQQALEKFAIAHDKMDDMPQWQLNLRLHWLLAAILAQQDRKIIRTHFEILMRDERNPRRKRAARIAFYGGRLAAKWVVRRH